MFTHLEVRQFKNIRIYKLNNVPLNMVVPCPFGFESCLRWWDDTHYHHTDSLCPKVSSVEFRLSVTKIRHTKDAKEISGDLKHIVS